jgi:hypothetical protein
MEQEKKEQIIKYNNDLIQRKYSKYKCFKKFYEILNEVKNDEFKK